ncbi:MAG: UbiA family prenyltransferase [Deltaproteobacteria bacterium]|nr:UbiA family prenyltransferase [Deltaproteobacteria bacterium]
MKLSVALRLGRVSNLPTVTTNVLAALALSGAAAAPWTIAVICLGISLLYLAGMFLNDAFDRTIDAIERPERPIPSGQVSAADVFGAGFALMAFGILAIAGVALATGAGWWPIASAIGLAALIVYYDMRHKANPFAPLVMGLCRVGAYTTAALAGGASLDESLIIGCGLLLAYLIGLSFIARHENTSKLTQLWPLAFLIVPFVVLQPAGGGPWMFAIYLMFAGWTGRCLWLVWKRNFRTAVGGLIAGISLLDALFVIRGDQPVLAGVACGAFLLTTILQRRVPGT